jgi:hypothetical protein
MNQRTSHVGSDEPAAGECRLPGDWPEGPGRSPLGAHLGAMGMASACGFLDSWPRRLAEVARDDPGPRPRGGDEPATWGAMNQRLESAGSLAIGPRPGTIPARRPRGGAEPATWGAMNQRLESAGSLAIGPRPGTIPARRPRGRDGDGQRLRVPRRLADATGRRGPGRSRRRPRGGDEPAAGECRLPGTARRLARGGSGRSRPAPPWGDGQLLDSAESPARSHLGDLPGFQVTRIRQ